MKQINVVSLFDGMSCARIALERAGFEVKNYIASEIDEHAIKVAQKNYPNNVQVGSVTDISVSKQLNMPWVYNNGQKLLPIEGGVDLLCGGSPCQGFSFAGKQLNFDDPRSKLFFEFVRLKDEANPKYFLLENVKMKQESQDVISQLLGVEPIKLNSSKFSAQSRNRLYWTNIPVDPNIIDKGINLKDIVMSGMAGENPVKQTERNARHLCSLDGKGLCATATMWKGAGNNGTTIIQVPTEDGIVWRKLNVTEVERLQTIEDDYTLVLDENGKQVVSNTQRYRMLGNGWNVDTIVHILKGMKF